MVFSLSITFQRVLYKLLASQIKRLRVLVFSYLPYFFVYNVKINEVILKGSADILCYYCSLLMILGNIVYFVLNNVYLFFYLWQTGEGTLESTGFFEVQIKGGQLIHSKKVTQCSSCTLLSLGLLPRIHSMSQLS